jgi:hypothetical protein
MCGALRISLIAELFFVPFTMDTTHMTISLETTLIAVNGDCYKLLVVYWESSWKRLKDRNRC